MPVAAKVVDDASDVRKAQYQLFNADDALIKAKKEVRAAQGGVVSRLKRLFVRDKKLEKAQRGARKAEAMRASAEKDLRRSIQQSNKEVDSADDALSVGIAEADTDVESFDKKSEDAATTLQRVARGWKERRDARKKEESATTLQALARGVRARKDFLKKKKAAGVIQSGRRGMLGRREAYPGVALAIEQTATALKKHEKVVEEGVAALKRRATMASLAAAEGASFATKDADADIAQLQERLPLAVKERNAARAEMKGYERAAQRLQKVWRGHKGRQQATEMQKVREKQDSAATRIQSHIRGRSARKQVEELRAKRREEDAATKLQSFARKKRAQRRVEVLKKEKETAQAATKIQALLKGVHARKEVKAIREKQTKAATTLQALARRYLAKKNVAQIREEHAKKEAEKRTNAATRIQSRVRGRNAQRRVKELRKEREAATKLQRVARGWKGRRDARKKEESATTLQALARGVHARKDLLKKKKAAEVIQSGRRGMLGRREAAKRREAYPGETLAIEQTATALKKHEKAVEEGVAALQRRATMASLAAGEGASFATKNADAGIAQLQKRLRRDVEARDAAHAEMKGYERAAQGLQKVWRGHKGRQQAAEMQKVREKQSAAATRIQSHIRGRSARKQAKALQAEQVAAQRAQEEDAAIRMQSAFRGKQARDRAGQLRAERAEREAAATKLQGVARGWKGRRDAKDARRKEQSATTLQALARGARVRKDLLKKKEAAEVIQSRVRGMLGRKKVEALRTEQAAVQRAQEEEAAEKQARVDEMRKTRAAVTSLQEKKRAASQERTKARERKQAEIDRPKGLFEWGESSALKDARSAESKAKRDLDEADEALVEEQNRLDGYGRRAVRKLQAAFRGRKGRTRAAELRAERAEREAKKAHAATIIQSHVRAKNARAQARALRAEKEAVQHVQEEAATRIQSHVRGISARKEIDRKRRLAAVVQANKDSYDEEKRLKAKRIEEAAARRAQEEDAAIRVQSVLRGKQARDRAGQLRAERAEREAVATKLQGVARGWKGRRDARDTRRKEQSATTLQALARGARVRKDLLKKKEAAEVIQSVGRGMLGRRQVEELRAKRREEDAATKLQSLARKKSAHRRVKALRKEREAAQAAARHAQEEAAAVRMQSALRGKQARDRAADLRAERAEREAAAEAEVGRKAEVQALNEKIEEKQARLLALNTAHVHALENKREADAALEAHQAEARGWGSWAYSFVSDEDRDKEAQLRRNVVQEKGDIERVVAQRERVQEELDNLIEQQRALSDA